MKSLTLIVSFLFLLSVGSCTKDDNVDPSNLAGTTWIYTATGNGVNIVETIKFTNSTSFTDHAVYTGAANLDITISGNYSYSPPNIELVMNSVTQNGTISGASMSVTTTQGNVAVYIKQ